jgi:HTH-type transcriptional regulator/antitoxin HigA
MTETTELQAAPEVGFAPDWISPPGDTIADRLEELGWKQTELAARTGFTPKHISELISGKASITAPTAELLSRVLGGSIDFWLAREAKYQAALERQRVRDALAIEASWLDELPLAEMVKRGQVKRYGHRGDQVRACLSYFGVGSVAAWRAHWAGPLAAFRASSKFEKKGGAVAAWLREGERAAEGKEAAPFDKAAFKAALSELRALTNEQLPDVFLPRLLRRCAAHGVVVVLVPAPTGCPISGATRWLTSDRALLQLSLRHKTNDHLWFTFFHEAAHLLLHGKRMQFIEGLDGLDAELEREADAFARDLLIPPAAAARLAALAPFSQVAVERFADQVGIAPGIVVGRLQHDGLLPSSHLNGLKVRYEWAGEA